MIDSNELYKDSFNSLLVSIAHKLPMELTSRKLLAFDQYRAANSNVVIRTDSALNEVVLINLITGSTIRISNDYIVLMDLVYDESPILSRLPESPDNLSKLIHSFLMLSTNHWSSMILVEKGVVPIYELLDNSRTFTSFRSMISNSTGISFPMIITKDKWNGEDYY